MGPLDTGAETGAVPAITGLTTARPGLCSGLPALFLAWGLSSSAWAILAHVTGGGFWLVCTVPSLLTLALALGAHVCGRSLGPRLTADDCGLQVRPWRGPPVLVAWESI